ncbi:MAG: DUF1127 domain-containing protein [Rhodopila sp.]|nr:DUF1127 domain-containing protein [Rhodopila sp.]
MSDLTMTRSSPVRPVAGRVARGHLAETLHLALRTYVTRQTLPAMTPRELADVGLTPTAALAEAARLPWDLSPDPHRRGFGGLAGHVQRALERSRIRRLTARL